MNTQAGIWARRLSIAKAHIGSLASIEPLEVSDEFGFRPNFFQVKKCCQNLNVQRLGRAQSQIGVAAVLLEAQPVHEVQPSRSAASMGGKAHFSAHDQVDIEKVLGGYVNCIPFSVLTKKTFHYFCRPTNADLSGEIEQESCNEQIKYAQLKISGLCH